MVFGSGKFVITGAKSEVSALQAGKIFTKAISKVLIEPDYAKGESTELAFKVEMTAFMI